MSFEGAQLQGSVKIAEKLAVSSIFAQFFHERNEIIKSILSNSLQSLQFQKINRAITSIDSQPTFDGGVLISVLGRLQVSCILFRHFFYRFCFNCCAIFEIVIL